MTFQTVVFTWDGEAMRPMPKYRILASRQFTAGERYPLEVREERSSKAHAFYHASVRSAWQNLDDDALEKLKTPTHLRKWALIETGWYDELQIDCLAEAMAMKMAIWSRSRDEYAEIRLRRNPETGKRTVLVVRTAKSQSMRAMDKQTFQASSRDVLELLSGAIHVPRRVLEREGQFRE